MFYFPFGPFLAAFCRVAEQRRSLNFLGKCNQSDTTNKLEANRGPKYGKHKGNLEIQNVLSDILRVDFTQGSEGVKRSLSATVTIFTEGEALSTQKCENLIYCFVFRVSSRCNTGLCTSYARSLCSRFTLPNVHIQICTNRWITALTPHAFRIEIQFFFYLSLIRWHAARCIYNLSKQDGMQPAPAYAKCFASEMMRNISFSHRRL